MAWKMVQYLYFRILKSPLNLAIENPYLWVQWILLKWLDYLVHCQACQKEFKHNWKATKKHSVKRKKIMFPFQISIYILYVLIYIYIYCMYVCICVCTVYIYIGMCVCTIYILCIYIYPVSSMIFHQESLQKLHKSAFLSIRFIQFLPQTPALPLPSISMTSNSPLASEGSTSMVSKNSCLETKKYGLLRADRSYY